MKLRASLQHRLPENLLEVVPSSFDIIGSREKAVAIVEIPCELNKHALLIADAIMEQHKNVKSVLRKKTQRKGELRLREFTLIKGDPDTEVIHMESGCRFRLDPRKTYFSPRESTERERIAKLVASGEEVLVMFSGVGPFAIVIARKNPTVRCTCIELNPDAHRYCLENIRLNHLEGRVQALEGDVRDVCPKLGKQFDRVLTPLPKGAHRFLDVAIPMVKPGGILHFYHWAPESDLSSDAYHLIENTAKKLQRTVEPLGGVKVSKYSPGFYKVRVDARIH